jgi:cytochrome d ubiquinol oxidase subunit I
MNKAIQKGPSSEIDFDEGSLNKEIANVISKK